MSEEERKKMDADLKKELLKKTAEDAPHTIEDAMKRLEGKIPTKPKEKKEE